MRQRRLAGFGFLGAMIVGTVIVCAQAQVLQYQREVLSFNELERDVDYVILEIEGHEYFAPTGNICHTSTSQCGDNTVSCYWMNPPVGGGTVDCAYCNGTDGETDRWCTQHPNTELSCVSSGTKVCGNVVEGTCCFPPAAGCATTKTCIATTTTLDKCVKKYCLDH